MFNKMIQRLSYKYITITFFIFATVTLNAQFLPTDSALIKIFDSDILIPILIDSAKIIA